MKINHLGKIERSTIHKEQFRAMEGSRIIPF